jgi:hypothetical protein
MPDSILTINSGSLEHLEISSSLHTSQSSIINFASASHVTGSFSGKLLGTATTAITTSYISSSATFDNNKLYVLTASRADQLTPGGKTIDGDIFLTQDNAYQLGSLGVAWSEIHGVNIFAAENLQTNILDFTNGFGVQINVDGITGSLVGSASYAGTASVLLGSVISASYAGTASNVLGVFVSSSRITASSGLFGPIIPLSDNTHTLGNFSNTWNNVYTSQIETNNGTLFLNGGNVLPNLSETYDLGSLVNVWASLFVQNISASMLDCPVIEGTASFATTASNARTSSFLLGSVVSASYAGTASVLLGSVISASYAGTASNVLGVFVSSSRITASNCRFGSIIPLSDNTHTLGNLDNVWNNVYTVQLNTNIGEMFLNGNFVPSLADSYDLGSPSSPWCTIYVNHISASMMDGTASFATTASALNEMTHLVMTRTLTGASGNFVNIGFWDITNGPQALIIGTSVGDPGFSMSKTYILNGFYGDASNLYTSGSWRTVLPIASTGNYNARDYRLEAMMAQSVLYMRLVTNGVQSGTCHIKILQLGGSNSTNLFTPLTTTGSTLTNNPDIWPGSNIGIEGGLVHVSSSLNVSQSIVGRSGFTGSLQGSASYSNTSSYVVNHKGFINLYVQSAKLPSTSSARVDAGDRMWRLLYDPSSPQSASWQFMVPSDYASSPRMHMKYAVMSAQGVPVSQSTWAFRTSAIGQGTTIQTFTTASTILTASVSASQTANTMITTSLLLTNSTNITASEMLVFELERMAGETLDTVSSDIAVLGLTFEYTTI